METTNIRGFQGINPIVEANLSIGHIDMYRGQLGTGETREAVDKVLNNLGYGAKRAQYYANNSSVLGYDIHTQVNAAVVPAVIAETPMLTAFRQLIGENRSIAVGKEFMIGNLDDAAKPAENVSDLYHETFNDMPQMGQDVWPLPMQKLQIGNIGWRAAQQAQQSGLPVGTRFALSAGKSIGVRWEQNTIGSGTGAAYYAMGRNGSLISGYGFSDNPDRATGTLTADWEGSTAATRLTDVLLMIQAARDLGLTGPFLLAPGANYWASTEDDHKAETSESLRSRILQIPSIQDIVVSPWTPDDHVYLIALDPAMVEVVVQSDLTPVSWNAMGGFGLQQWMFYGAINVIFRSDKNGVVGIVDFVKP